MVGRRLIVFVISFEENDGEVVLGIADRAAGVVDGGSEAGGTVAVDGHNKGTSEDLFNGRDGMPSCGIRRKKPHGLVAGRGRFG